MRAGQLRHRVTWQAPAEVVSGWGDGTPAHPSQWTEWAEVEFLTGLNRGGLTAEAEYRVTTRYRDGIDVTWQLSLGTRKLGIIATGDPEGRRRQRVTLARELV